MELKIGKICSMANDQQLLIKFELKRDHVMS